MQYEGLQTCLTSHYEVEDILSCLIDMDKRRKFGNEAFLFLVHCLVSAHSVLTWTIPSSLLQAMCIPFHA